MNHWTDEHRAFIVETYIKTSESVSATQNAFRAHFNLDVVPVRNSILLWVNNFRTRGSPLKRGYKQFGRPRTAITPEHVEAVRSSIEQFPRRSARQHAAALHLSDRSFRRILHTELKMHPYTLNLAQGDTNNGLDENIPVKTEPQDHTDGEGEEAGNESVPDLNEDKLTDPVKEEPSENGESAPEEENNTRRHYPKRRSTETYPRQCRQCDLVLANSGAYEVHQQWHAKRASLNFADDSDEDCDEEDNTCSHCFKVFSNKYHLKKHMKRHKTPTKYTSEKNGKFKTYWCNKCHKACRGYMELQSHKQEHEFAEINGMKDPSTSSVKDEFKRKVIKSEVNEGIEGEEDDENGVELGILAVADYAKESTEMQQDGVGGGGGEEEAASEIHVCKFCQKVFSRMTQLRVHMGWHKRIRLSDKSKVMKSELPEEYQIKQQPKRYKQSLNNFCNICQRHFNNEIALEVHNMEFHQDIDESMFTLRCEMCDIEYDTQAALDKHLEFHRIVEKRKELRKQEQYKMQQHQQQHQHQQQVSYKKEREEPKIKIKEEYSNPEYKEDNKQYMCKHCHYVCDNLDKLNTHIRSSHKDALHKCEYCRRTFARPCGLASHIRHNHKQNALLKNNKEKVNFTDSPGTSEKFLYKCSICFKGFNIPKDLRNHIIATHPF